MMIAKIALMSFKGDTQKMRIERRGMVKGIGWIPCFKGDTQKMRIES